MEPLLDGLTAVITGGSSGIGLATAQLFVQEGATVIIVGRDSTRLTVALERLGKQATAIAADLSHEVGVIALADALRSHTTGIDVLFANAGASNAPELFETTEQTFDMVINSNLKSAFFTVTHCFDLLSAGASVILTSSVSHGRGAIGDPLYAASKAAVRTLVRGFAAQTAFLHKRVRVNALSFGAVRTPMTGPEDVSLQTALEQWAQEHIPMQRWAAPEEAAGPALLLASKLSSYMTGTEVAVDGGLAQL